MPVNLLTANQANGTESGTTTGFTAQGSGVTLTSSTAQYYGGTRSLKVVTTGGSTYQGAKLATSLVQLKPKPMTITVKVRASVSTDYRFGISSASTSFSSYKTVSLTADTWTTIEHTFQPTKRASDGVIVFDTGNAQQAADIYLDQWGAWYGEGGDWAYAGEKVHNVAPPNANQKHYYEGLNDGVTAAEEDAISLGKNDNEIDFDPDNNPSLTLTAEADQTDETGLTWTLTVSPPILAKWYLGYDDDAAYITAEGSVTHVFPEDNTAYNCTVDWRGFTQGTCTVTCGTP